MSSIPDSTNRSSCGVVVVLIRAYEHLVDQPPTVNDSLYKMISYPTGSRGASRPWSHAHQHSQCALPQPPAPDRAQTSPHRVKPVALVNSRSFWIVSWSEAWTATCAPRFSASVYNLVVSHNHPHRPSTHQQST